MDKLKDLLIVKAFSIPSLVGITVWFVLEVIPIGIFTDMEINESRLDFRCNVKSNDQADKDFISKSCFDEYGEKYEYGHKFPVLAFVVLNLLVILIIPVIYSMCVKSTINELETQRQQNHQESRRLFIAYCCQLAAGFAVAILFVVLKTRFVYPENFPSNFHCTLANDSSALLSSNFKQVKSNSYDCHNARAAKKTFWTHFAVFINGIFVLLAFIEIVWIFSRARNRRHFMQDSYFYNDHLAFKRNPNGGVPLLPISVEQHKLKADLQSLKEDIIAGTKQHRDLKQPFRSNPGEGAIPRVLDIDQIFVNLLIHEGRAKYEFPEDRREQLKVFPKPRKDRRPDGEVCVENMIDGQHKNILVVGRPGIGKTMLSTRLFRLSALDAFKYVNFDVAFLLKFRRYNSLTNLNLRELLTRSETIKNLNDDVWNYIATNPSKVLMMFDGVDEFFARSEIAKDDAGYIDNVEQEMPLHFLYHKIASGKLLPGATVITTSRPTAVSCVKHLDFDRVVEILGFTSEEVKDYVEKFTEGDQDPNAKETIWQHLSTNINLFFLCYIPVNCFIICSCLSRYNASGLSLPTKLTKIYSTALKIFFFRHNDEYRQSPDVSDQLSLKRFNELPLPVQEIFKRLGKIAFEGIEEGRLIFTRQEVAGLEDCGLFHRLPDLAGKTPLDPSEAQYCFMHLTVQEFLAAKHVIDTKKETEELQKFVADHIQLSAWQVVIQFVAGLLDPNPGQKMRNIEIFTEPFLKSKGPMSLCNWQPHPVKSRREREVTLTLCKCLYELDVNEQSLMANKIEEIGFDAMGFADCGLAPVDCVAIVHFLKNSKRTTSLNLERNNIGWRGCEEIQKWIVESKGDCKLRILHLDGNEIGDKGAKHLSDALKHVNCNLTELTLAGCKIGDKGAKNLSDALKHVNCKVTRLTFGGFRIGDLRAKSAKYLSDALKHANCKVTRLTLSGFEIEDSGAESAKYLRDALKHVNCKVTVLTLGDFGRGNSTVESAKYLSDALKHVNCKITHLTLSGFGTGVLGAESAKYLSDALKHVNCKVTQLTLSGFEEGHSGLESAKYLSDALKHVNCKVTELTLYNCRIEDEGVEYLSDALKDEHCKLSVNYF